MCVCLCVFYFGRMFSCKKLFLRTVDNICFNIFLIIFSSFHMRL